MLELNREGATVHDHHCCTREPVTGYEPLTARCTKSYERAILSRTEEERAAVVRVCLCAARVA